MADIDDELLALAGSDEESGDESRSASMSPDRRGRSLSRDSRDRSVSRRRGRRDDTPSEEGEQGDA
jgi:hypothetical protein